MAAGKVLVLFAFVCLFGPHIVAAATDYQLQVIIAPQDLQTIVDAGQHVILVRESQNVYSKWHIVWASFQHFPNNFVTWNSSGLAVYAATALPADLRSILVGSWAYAMPGLVYPFDDSLIPPRRGSYNRNGHSLQTPLGFLVSVS